MFRFEREAPREWREELYAIGGRPNLQAAYLDIFWWPGYPPRSGGEDHTIQRWTVWEMIPRAALEKTNRNKAQARELVGALTGPPPASLRTLVTRNGRTVVRSSSIVSQEQWEIHRKTSCYPLPHWVIQGDHGGHLWSFPPAYQMLLRLSKRRLHPPPPGNLPYAEWDNRVRSQLLRERELRERLEAFSTRDRESKTDSHHKREQIEVEREGRRALLAWLDKQMGNAANETQGMLGRADIPVRDDAEVTDEQLEAESEQFVMATNTDPNTI